MRGERLVEREGGREWGERGDGRKGGRKRDASTYEEAPGFRPVPREREEE